MVSVLGTLAVGLMVGLLARALKPGKDEMGWIMTVLLAVAGSFLATYLGLALGWYEQNEAVSWIASVVGAMLLLAVFSLVKWKM